VRQILNPREPALRECTQDESLWDESLRDSRDGPGAARNNAAAYDGTGRFPVGEGGASAGTACCAPTGFCYGKARPGVESGSKLPHSTESWRRLIRRSAVEKVKRAAPSRNALRINPFGMNPKGFTRRARRATLRERTLREFLRNSRKTTAQFCGNFLLRVGVRACCVRHDRDVMVAQQRVRAAVDKF
jgi:hypothetical protein